MAIAEDQRKLDDAVREYVANQADGCMMTAYVMTYVGINPADEENTTQYGATVNTGAQPTYVSLGLLECTVAETKARFVDGSQSGD